MLAGKASITSEVAHWPADPCYRKKTTLNVKIEVVKGSVYSYKA
jgi:hypothetical protein